MRCGVILGLCAAAAAGVAGRAQPVEAPAVKQTTLQWFGHGFFVVSSVTGVRVAIDPFDQRQIPAPGPARVPADVLLVTHEATDASVTDRIDGSPQIYRGSTGEGLNRGSGMLFKGSRSYRSRDRNASLGRNVIYSFKLDGVRFAFLGNLGHPLNTEEAAAVGTSEVVVAPVPREGGMTRGDVLATAKVLGARVLIPARYKTAWTEKAGDVAMGTLDGLLEGPEKVVRLDSDIVVLQARELPEQLEIWVPAAPGGAAEVLP